MESWDTLGCATMGFEFKLESLRRYRLFQQEQMQKAMADAQRLLSQAQQRLADHLALRARTEADFRQQDPHGVSAAQTSLYRQYLERLGVEIAERQRQVKTAEAQCEEQRQALMDAMQKRKTLDRLKEKDAQTFLVDSNREEEKFINEMAINRFTLKQG